MIGDYTLKPLTYRVHNGGVKLVDIIEAPSYKYVGRDRAHGTGLINLYPGSHGQLMEPQAVQKYSHALRTRKTIW